MAQTSNNKPSHLKALLRKNWILWKRNWCMSLCEILIPFIFAVLILAFRAASPLDDIPTRTYWDKPATSFTFDGTLNPSYFKNCNADENGGIVAIVPDPATDSLAFDVNQALISAGFTPRAFKNNQAIDDYTSQTNYASISNTIETLCFAVVINKNDVNNQYEYMLRFNVSGYDDPDLPNTADPRVNKIAFEDIDSLYKYGHSGFLSLQNYIDNLILQRETTTPSAKISSSITSRTVQAYTEDNLGSNLQGQLSLLVALPLLLPYLRFMNGILTEKEKKIREGMRIMGLKNRAFYLSWFITYFIVFTIISILCSIVLNILFKLSSWGLIFLWHWEYSMTLMAMGFLITTFFSKAKVGNVAGFVIALFFGFLQSAANSDTSSGVLFAISFAPQTSLGLSADHMLNLESARVGLTSDTIDLEIDQYQMNFHYITMFIAFIIFILLGFYLDQVLPSDFGVRKHPLFCFMRNKNSSGKHRRVDSIDKHQYKQEELNFEPAANALIAQDQSNESIKVQGLRKVYDTGKVAVDNVSFNMYKGQIFALLGHNGAGKTTTISMMTGLFGSTSGSTKVFGLDVQEDLEEVRKTMGICPQHDILFDNLTVKEHLEMYAVFKGVPAKDIPSEVEKTILDIGLSEKREYLSKNLSGGQKRKLSIGMAFIGGSKFILLDEPSSGMDTSARRKLWDMLKNYKHDRVVLLTTHFMDEADYLGDRIGIMAEGKLKCLGSPLFLKTKFGIGYNLTMVKKDINVHSEPIKTLIQKHVPESNVLSDVSAEFALQLPLEATSKFQPLFDELDANMTKLGISSYGVSVTTLEEVFLNVAKIAAPEKHYKKKDETNLSIADDLDDYNIEQDRIKGSFNIFRTHFIALVKKRIQYTKRDKRGLICELILPILMVIGGILIANSAVGSDVKALVLNDSLYDYRFQMDYNSIIPSDNSAIDPAFINKFNTASLNPHPVSENTLAAFDARVTRDQGPGLISPINVFSVLMNSYNPTTFNYEYTAFLDTRAQEGSAYAMNRINNAILRAATGDNTKTIITVIAPFTKTAGSKSIDQVFSGLIYAFVLAIAMSLIPASMITYIVKEREFNAKHQQIVSGVSIAAYWFSNFFVDIIKYMIPAVINALFAMALDADALIDGDKLGALWLDFILYGFAIIPFVYLIAFLFKNYGTAQIASFFFNFCTGFILGLVVALLRLFDSTRSVGDVLQWLFRPLPSFAMTTGFLNLANRDVFTMIYDRTSQMSAYDVLLTGGDLLFLAISAIVYFILIFVVESLKNKQGLNSALSREASVPYVPKNLDEDVEREMREVEASDNQTYSIKVDKLRKVYPIGKGQHKVAVDQLSFGVKNGECFALLGVNGAGKTTTFKILSGDYTQTSGRAHINGYEIPMQLAQAQRNIGYCPQFDSILELLTAKEHLYLYAAIKGIPENIRGRMVEKQLVEMNLKQYENIPAGTYSGGNKRKLSVAIAMIGNPAVVFLDEPSTGMDPEARRFMWNVISRISRERKQSSIILTTHSMEEAEALATKMGIMVNGNLKCLGTSQHIKNKFGGGYEIEVKLELPTKEEVDSMKKKLGAQHQESVDSSQVDTVLGALNAGNLKKEITEDGAGSAIHSELKKGKVMTSLLVEWVLIEKSGDQLKSFLRDNFGEVLTLEHFQSFYRFKASNNITIGDFFGLLERNKSQLKIQQYSIKQGSIEQIFNTFAAEDNVHGDHAKVELSIK